MVCGASGPRSRLSRRHCWCRSRSLGNLLFTIVKLRTMDDDVVVAIYGNLTIRRRGGRGGRPPVDQLRPSSDQRRAPSKSSLPGGGSWPFAAGKRGVPQIDTLSRLRSNKPDEIADRAECGTKGWGVMHAQAQKREMPKVYRRFYRRPEPEENSSPLVWHTVRDVVMTNHGYGQ